MPTGLDNGHEKLTGRFVCRLHAKEGVWLVRIYPSFELSLLGEMWMGSPHFLAEAAPANRFVSGHGLRARARDLRWAMV